MGTKTSLLAGTMLAALLSASTALSADQKPDFVSGGVLKICTSGEFPPMEYYENPGDKDLVGFEIDVMDAIAKRWGAKAEYVVGDFKGLLPSLDSKRCDLVASGIMITPARVEKYDGIPYFGSHVVLVTAASDTETKVPADVSGKIMAIEAGTTYEQTVADLNAELEAAGKAPIQAQTYPSASGVIEQILVGRATATITQDTTAAYRMLQVPGRLAIPYTYEESENYGIYLRKSEGDRQMLKEAIEALQASGEMKAFLKKWNLPETSTDVSHDVN
ncbi:transporter substrate-binding domain-containing protein [Sinorhizobium meliloti]|nr:transporter substrate-binding domain-containing protein [Sinorhizobium meliloti]MDW9390533.1 transporter substrate-binding domain-containing protein [Sinorhizobium meliloti]MDW9435196.1 transporter substrate-binding domain-containing protein [Sinorhizobium meliloti]MDW9481068.1 transporter substrate-binding domain-containing protein [Sinorhizobium meliloti]MDW9548214.1 transporter substrate-binding domain-containing protein [Sinorhizobium meliloti]